MNFFSKLLIYLIKIKTNNLNSYIIQIPLEYINNKDLPLVDTKPI